MTQSSITYHEDDETFYSINGEVCVGQIIKTLKEIPFLESVEIELNDTIYGNEKIIHFHYHNIRYEMSLSDYLTILSGIRLSEIILTELKK